MDRLCGSGHCEECIVIPGQGEFVPKEEYDRLEKEVERLKERAEYTKSMGFEFGTIKESNNPNGRLQHFYRDGSELYRLHKDGCNGISLQSENQSLQKEVERFKTWHKNNPDAHDVYCESREGKKCNCGLDELLKGE